MFNLGKIKGRQSLSTAALAYPPDHHTVRLGTKSNGVMVDEYIDAIWQKLRRVVACHLDFYLVKFYHLEILAKIALSEFWKIWYSTVYERVDN